MDRLQQILRQEGLTKTASSVVIPIELRYSSGLSAEEFGFDLESIDPEYNEAAEETVSSILKYLGASNIEALKLIGSEEEQWLGDSFSKGKVLGQSPAWVIRSAQSFRAIAGNFGRVKAVLLEGQVDGWLIK